MENRFIAFSIVKSELFHYSNQSFFVSRIRAIKLKAFWNIKEKFFHQSNQSVFANLIEPVLTRVSELFRPSNQSFLTIKSELYDKLIRGFSTIERVFSKINWKLLSTIESEFFRHIKAFQQSKELFVQLNHSFFGN